MHKPSGVRMRCCSMASCTSVCTELYTYKKHFDGSGNMHTCKHRCDRVAPPNATRFALAVWLSCEYCKPPLPQRRPVHCKCRRGTCKLPGGHRRLPITAQWTHACPAATGSSPLPRTREVAPGLRPGLLRMDPTTRSCSCLHRRAVPSLGDIWPFTH
jgi:hypothetical protein